MSIKRKFVFATLITMLGYLAESLMYYSQLSLMNEHFENSIIFEVADGWANLAQAIGMICLVILASVNPRLYCSRFHAAGLFAGMLPVVAISLLCKSSVVLFTSMLILNFLIGMASAFYFGLLSSALDSKNAVLGFSIAYGVGSLGSWLISIIDVDFLISKQIILVDFALLLVVIILLVKFEDIKSDNKIRAFSKVGTPPLTIYWLKTKAYSLSYF